MKGRGEEGKERRHRRRASEREEREKRNGGERKWSRYSLLTLARTWL